MNRATWILPSAVLFVAAAAALVPAGDARSAPEKTTFTGDTTHSHVLFRIKHMNASWQWGRFDDFTVSFASDDKGESLDSIAFDVKTASVDTGNAKRDQHLKSPDFFNAAEFTDISFKSTAVKSAAADAWDVTGDLTLHGVTKPVTVRVSRVGAADGSKMKMGQLVGLESTFSIKRSDYDMGNMVGPVGDDVMLTVAVEGSHK